MAVDVMSWGLFGLKNHPDSRRPRGQEWGGLTGWKGGGREEFLDRMFLRRLSLHSAPDPSPQPWAWASTRLPPLALALPFPSSTTSPQIHFFPSPPSLRPPVYTARAPRHYPSHPAPRTHTVRGGYVCMEGTCVCHFWGEKKNLRKLVQFPLSALWFTTPHIQEVRSDV